MNKCRHLLILNLTWGRLLIIASLAVMLCLPQYGLQAERLSPVGVKTLDTIDILPGNEAWDDQFYNSADGLNTGMVWAVLVDGYDVYVGGTFTALAGNPRINNIGRWNAITHSWYPLGNGVNGTVYSLYLEASGLLFAGGTFTQAGVLVVNHVARYDRGPDTWSALGSGVDDTVAAFSRASNGDLLVGGNFLHAGGGSANHIAIWNYGSWAPLISNSGNGVGGNVSCIKGTAKGIYVGGNFGSGIQFLNDASNDWQMLGSGSSAIVWDIALDGDRLYASGTFLQDGIFINSLAQWDGTRWSKLGDGLDGGPVYKIVVNGGYVYAVGGFSVTQNGQHFASIARYNLNTHFWSGFGGGRVNIGDGKKYIGPDNAVQDIGIMSNGDIYIGGPFYMVYQADDSALAGPRLARWQAAYNRWTVMNYGMTGGVTLTSDGATVQVGHSFDDPVRSMVYQVQTWRPGDETWALHSELPGDVLKLLRTSTGGLYAAGRYYAAGDPNARGYVARWESSSWTLWKGFDAPVRALAMYKGNLYAGGEFTSVSGQNAQHIAEYGPGTGNVWMGLVPVGAGNGVKDPVTMLASDSDYLYLAGAHVPTGTSDYSPVLRWNELAWSGLPLPPWELQYDCQAGEALALFNNGAPTAKTQVFTASLSGICLWDGSAWTLIGRLATPNHYPYERARVLLPTFEGNLIVGGCFQSVDGVLVNNLAMWNGAGWQAFGSGLTGSVGTNPTEVFDATLHSYGLFVVGNFASAGGKEALGFAHWAPSTANFLVNDQGITVWGWADGITYQFAPGSFSSPVVFSHADLTAGQIPPRHISQAAIDAAPARTLRSTGIFFQNSAAYQVIGGAANLLKPLTITVPYNDFQVMGFPLTTLGLYYWTGSQWQREPSSVLQADQHQVTASPNHLGIFGLLAEPKWCSCR